MSSTINVYSAEPALPLLAQSLLPRFEAEDENQDPQPKPAFDSSQRWNLKHDLEQGVQSSANTVFRCGTVVGFSKLRERSKDDDYECVGELPRRLLTAHLRKSSRLSPTDPNAFIIYPASYSAFAPETLLSSILSPAHQPVPTREEAIKCLDSVQLLPVFNFPTAVQAISNVSDALNRIQERHQAGTIISHPVLFIIAGLDTLAEGVIRTSNPVKGAAVLTSALRTLTQLSRMHASFLSVILVNTSGLGMHTQHPQSTAQAEDVHPSYGEGIHSIFRTAAGPVFPSLLMKTLDQGIDTHLLLSTVRNTQVVEVIKDRVADGVGRWCVWDTKQ